MRNGPGELKSISSLTIRPITIGTGIKEFVDSQAPTSDKLCYTNPNRYLWPYCLAKTSVILLPGGHCSDDPGPFLIYHCTFACMRFGGH